MKILIMAGGQGTRFWPVSRRRIPKQFHSVVSQETMLQQTAARLEGYVPVHDIFVVCSPEYESLVLQQLPALSREQLILEPEPRNTAPCIGLSALYLNRRFPGEVMAVLPADHVIERVEQFHEVLRQAEHLAKQDWLVVFGIQPSFAATGYGYLERGEQLAEVGGPAAFRVARFTEKPDENRARAFLKSGKYFWNSGMFVWSIPTLMREFQVHMPAFHSTLLHMEESFEDPHELARRFKCLERNSIDFGLMEKSNRVAMISCGDLGWNDVGSWKAVHEVRSRRSDDTVSNTRCLVLDSSGSLVHSEKGKLVALIGIRDLIVVETEDALLVCCKDKSEAVKEMVAQLRREGLEEWL